MSGDGNSRPLLAERERGGAPRGATTLVRVRCPASRSTPMVAALVDVVDEIVAKLGSSYRWTGRRAGSASSSGLVPIRSSWAMGSPESPPHIPICITPKRLSL